MNYILAFIWGTTVGIYTGYMVGTYDFDWWLILAISVIYLLSFGFFFAKDILEKINDKGIEIYG